MQKDYHSVYPRPLFSPGGGELNLQPNFQKEGGALGRTSTFKGGLLGKRGMTFYRGIAIFIKKIN